MEYMNLPSRTDPYLLDLTERYAKLNLFPHSLWKTWADGIDVLKFRGENAYLAQMWNMTEERYWNTAEYVYEHAREVACKLDEDDAFGCVTFRDSLSGATISRDFLDSVLEIQFLRDTLPDLWNADNIVNILDIGAGYGRFAHRITTVMSNVIVACVDGVPLSTYLCDYYLKYRGVVQATRGCAVQVQRKTDYERYKCEVEIPGWKHFDLACNMQSFSEMPLAAINFWLDLCADLKVPYFFLEPHASDLIHAHFFSTEPDGRTHLDYLPLFEKYGYKLKARQFKFPEAESARYIYNSEMCLFERNI